MIPFDMLAQFAQAKAGLAKLTGDDEEYYRILLEEGYAKSSHIPNQAGGWPILARMREALAEAKYRTEEAAAIREFGGG